MLQQTTVQAVIPYYEDWLKQFPDLQALARARLQKVLRTWQSLGYYERARNLHKAAKIIIKDYGGEIPQDYGDLASLPGFGPYTTAAVLSLAFGKPYPVLDANVRRVLMRLTRTKGEARAGHDKALLRYVSPFLPPKEPGLFNQALMELGALVCRPSIPLCLVCPWQGICLACQAGEQEVIPTPRKRSYKTSEAVVGIIREGGKYLIQKRPSRGLFADLWEFPGGKVEKGETPEEALRREFKEELGAKVKDQEFLLKVKHAYTQFQVTLHAYECSLQNRPRLKKDTHRWVTLRGMQKYPFPSGSVKIILFLGEREGAQYKNR